MRFAMRSFLVSLAALALSGALACGGGEPKDDLGKPDVQSDVDDLIIPTDADADEGRDDPGTDGEGVGNDGDEGVAEDVGPEVAPCPGSFLCPCQVNDDCFSDICIETMDQSICSKECGVGIECPEGWACDVVGSFGSEKIYGCVYPWPNLCRPCQDDEDCVPKAGAGNRKFLCIDSGPEGKFCGTQCTKTSECPADFQCVPVATSRGEVNQCRPTDGQCPCTDKYKNFQYQTTCYVQNTAGTCTGLRTCDQLCGAKTPADEACNLEDDNCNNKIDEEIAPRPCPLTNAYGTCEGMALCITGSQNNCQGAYPSPEVCNGKDDNCDDFTDEGFPDDDIDKIANCVDPDIDGDGVPNASDNCPLVPNPAQTNNDAAEEGSAKTGDVCDDDDDNDGVPDPADNCPTVKNVGQGNVDLDPDGDSCDCDADGDGFPNNANLDMLGQKCADPGVSKDNCTLVPNVDQKDTNLDMVGDACDCDADGDTVTNNNPGCPTVDHPDNCRTVPNLDQANLDLDNLGDACDCDIDNDQVGNNNPECPLLPVVDNCVMDPNTNQANTDELLPGGDLLGDVCDCDIDADGVMNDNVSCPPASPKDNCTYKPNPDQLNTTGGVFGDACNDDWDNDGIPNTEDNCPLRPNTDQSDVDVDGSGDVCDCDADGDGILNDGFDQDDVPCPTPPTVDNCLRIGNPEQLDFDLDNIGDACDCDIDGDGDPQPNFDCPTPVPQDCEPFDPAISHLTQEVCNTKDDNCDGEIDEENARGCQTFYFDQDGDGYGTEQTKCLCAASGNYRALAGGDCKDNDPTINPGVQEICNNDRDDNCNSSENDINATACIKFYRDMDGDGYGTADFECRCFSTGGEFTTRYTGDCDDTNGQVNPNRSEVCFDSLDNNCNGSQNDENALNCKQFFFDGDGDNVGTSQSKCYCFASDQWRAPVLGDCNDGDGEVYPGRKEICSNGKDDNCDSLQDTEGSEGCLTYFYDGDNDSYGVTNDSKCLCAITGSYKARDSGDCQDSNPNINPSVAEKCDGVDNNCDTRADENPGTLCSSLPNATATCQGGGCIIGSCSAGYFNVNGVSTDGCECGQDAGDNTGNECGAAIHLGSLADDTTSVLRYGKVVPDADNDWYVVDTVDSADSGNLAAPGRDKFNLVAKLLAPTDGSLAVDVRRGGCGVGQTCGGVTYQWTTNGRWGQAGENPCVSTPGTRLWDCCAPGGCDAGAGAAETTCCGGSLPAGQGTPCTDDLKNVRHCSNNASQFYIRVYRASGSASTCSATDYALEISNGK